MPKSNADTPYAAIFCCRSASVNRRVPPGPPSSAGPPLTGPPDRPHRVGEPYTGPSDPGARHPCRRRGPVRPRRRNYAWLSTSV